jgi:hypothetical protein
MREMKKPSRWRNRFVCFDWSAKLQTNYSIMRIIKLLSVIRACMFECSWGHENERIKEKFFELGEETSEWNENGKTRMMNISVVVKGSLKNYFGEPQNKAWISLSLKIPLVQEITKRLVSVGSSRCSTKTSI